MVASTTSDSSSSHDSRRRRRRHSSESRRGGDRDREALKIREKRDSPSTRRNHRQRRESSSGSYSDSSSYSSCCYQKVDMNRHVCQRSLEKMTSLGRKKRRGARIAPTSETSIRLKRAGKRKEEAVQHSSLSSWGRDRDDGVHRSAVSGKKILLKLDMTKEDTVAESKRSELLKFLNASFD